MGTFTERCTKSTPNGVLGFPHLKTPGVFFKKSFYLANKAIVNFDFLVFGAVWVLDSFVDQDLFNQGVEQFRCQFCGVGVLLDEVYPLFSIGGALLLSGKSCLQRFYFPGQLLLFRLILLRQHIKVVLCNTPCDPILVHLGKQVVEFGFALFCLVQLCCLLFLACCPLLVAGSEKPLYQVLLVESSLSGPVLDPRQDIGVQNIIADIVHGALVQALTVFAAVVVAVRLLVLPVGTKCQRPAAVGAFH